MPATIHTGDAFATLQTLPSNTYDAMLTDPPYGITFMGKEWDKGVPSADVWREALRVLKPGAYALVACGTRTQHRMVTNLEDAGFEVRDVIAWIYGSGFPKSLDVSKAIDKAAGAERKILSERANRSSFDPHAEGGGGFRRGTIQTTTPATEAAQQWQGYGTALKPAMELWTLVRKPPEGTNAQNVLKWGCGAINIDGCRIETADYLGKGTMGGIFGNGQPASKPPAGSIGRWPANVIHDGSDEVIPLFPRDNNGSAARFFYTAKANRREREAGLENHKIQEVHRYGKGIGEGLDPNAPAKTPNPHPTVKPLALTTYLAKLLLPPTRNTPRQILTPYSGVGSEIIGSLQAGWDQATGIELDPEYVAIAQERIKHHVLP